MDRTSPTIKKLTELNDDDWTVALEKCQRLINSRVRGKTKFGCHSEEYLGMSPFDYYVKEAIDKLYSGSWKWKEEYSFSEQMCRIVGSIISEKVRKYKNDQKKNPELVNMKVSFEDVDYLFGVDFDEHDKVQEREKVYEHRLNTIMEAIDGNEEMEILLLLIMDGKSNNEICSEMNWERKKLYKVADRLKNKVKNYLAQDSKEIKK